MSFRAPQSARNLGGGARGLRRSEAMPHLGHDFRSFRLDGVVHAWHAILSHETLQRRRMSRRVKHQEAAAAGADDLAAEYTEALSNLLVDFIDRGQRDPI